MAETEGLRALNALKDSELEVRYTRRDLRSLYDVPVRDLGCVRGILQD